MVVLIVMVEDEDIFSYCFFIFNVMLSWFVSMIVYVVLIIMLVVFILFMEDDKKFSVIVFELDDVEEIEDFKIEEF